MATVSRDVFAFEHGVAARRADRLTPEAPLQITINNTPFATTLRTPGAEIALARGLFHSEGLLTGTPAIIWKETLDPESGYIGKVDAEIDPSLIREDFAAMRSPAASAACGMCSTRRIEDVLVYGEPIRLHATPAISIGTITRLFEELRKHQDTFIQSGGCHAAALVDNDGTILSCHEDVGRHNAVDKTIGALLFEGCLDDATLLLVSGRISYEIIAKAYRAAVPIVAAVSAPSSMAIDYGAQLGITVLGFCREGRATVYSHPERICELQADAPIK